MDDTFETPLDKPSVTVEQLDQLVEKIFTKRKEIEDQEAVTSSLNKELMELKAQAVEFLKDLGRKDFKSPLGTISISQKWRVNLPQSDDDKSALFGWLREKGLFDKYATVNSQALNSLYMAEWEAAKRTGDGLEFTLPGIGERKLFEDLGIRKR